MEFELRPWRMEDAETIARYANNPKVAANLRIDCEQRGQGILCRDIAQTDLCAEQRTDDLRDDRAGAQNRGQEGQRTHDGNH